MSPRKRLFPAAFDKRTTGPLAGRIVGSADFWEGTGFSPPKIRIHAGEKVYQLWMRSENAESLTAP